MEKSVSHTTREPRPQEIDGKDYHFITHEQFEKGIANDEFIDITRYNNNYYGLTIQRIVCFYFLFFIFYFLFFQIAFCLYIVLFLQNNKFSKGTSKKAMEKLKNKQIIPILELAIQGMYELRCEGD